MYEGDPTDNRTTIQVSEDIRKQLRVLASTRDSSYQELLEEMIAVFRELDETKTIISIPKKLGNEIGDRIQGSDFNDLSEYVTFILRLLLFQEELVEKDDKLDNVRKRLESLGYL